MRVLGLANELRPVVMLHELLAPSMTDDRLGPRCPVLLSERMLPGRLRLVDVMVKLSELDRRASLQVRG